MAGASYPPLQTAVRALDVPTAAGLLEALKASGKNPRDAVRDSDEEGQTLLHHCAEVLRVDDDRGLGLLMVELLVTFGASVTVGNTYGEPPLTLAVRSVAQTELGSSAEARPPRLAAVRGLLEARAEADAADSFAGETPLMEAALQGDAALCRLLLEFRADPARRSLSERAARDFAEDLVPARPDLLELLDPKRRPAESEEPALAPESAAEPARPSSSRSSKAEEALPPEEWSEGEAAAAAETAALLASGLREASEAADVERLEALLDGARAEAAAAGSAAAAILPTALAQRDVCGHSLLHMWAQASSSSSAAPLDDAPRERALRALVAAGILGVNSKNRLGETPLALAARAALTAGLLQDPRRPVAEGAMRALLEARAEPDAADAPRWETPLMEAASAGSLATCQLLLEFRADPERRTFAGLTALDFAGSPEVQELLEGRRAELVAAASAELAARAGQQALDDPVEEAFRAARRLDAGALHAVLDSPARDLVLLSANEGQSLLHAAAQTPPTAQVASQVQVIVRLLLLKSADVACRDVLGETPLATAVHAAIGARLDDGGPESADNGRLYVVRALLDEGADSNAADTLNGETALMEAACEHDVPLCRLLLSCRADPRQKNASGMVAWDFVDGGDEQIQALLQDAIKAQGKDLPETELPDAERWELERLKAEQAAEERQEAARRAAEQLEIVQRQAEAERREAEQAKAERREVAHMEAEKRQTEEKRLEAERLEAERHEAERREAELKEAEQREVERLEAERREAEMQEAQRKEAELKEAERREAERLEAERREAEMQEAERKEAERKEAELKEAERREAERLEAERHEAEIREAERQEAERLRAEQEEAERLEAERLEAERRQAEAERIEAERREAERLEAERREAERLAAEQRLEAERREAEQRESQRVEAARQEAAQQEAEAERQAADRKAAEEAWRRQEDERRVAAAAHEEAMRVEAPGIPPEFMELLRGEPHPLTFRKRLKACRDPLAVTRARDSDGLALLHFCVMAPPSDKIFATAALLLQHRAEVDGRNVLGETPLLLATRAALDHVGESSEGPWLRPMRKLLEARADPDAADLLGETALIEAACCGATEVCRMLLNARASPVRESSCGLSALNVAQCEGHAEVVRLLHEACAEQQASTSTVTSQQAPHPPSGASPGAVPGSGAEAGAEAAAAGEAAAPLQEPMLLKVVVEATGEVLEVRVHPGSTVGDLRPEVQSRLGLSAEASLPLRPSAGAPALPDEALLGEWAELLAGSPAAGPLPGAEEEPAPGAETAETQEGLGREAEAAEEPEVKAPPECVPEPPGPELPARAQSAPEVEVEVPIGGVRLGGVELPSGQVRAEQGVTAEAAEEVAARAEEPPKPPKPVAQAAEDASDEAPVPTRVGWWEDLPEIPSDKEDEVQAKEPPKPPKPVAQAAEATSDEAPPVFGPEDLSLVSVVTGGTGGTPPLPGEEEWLEAGTGGETDPAKLLELLRDACKKSGLAVEWCTDTDALRELLRTARRWDAASVKDLKRSCMQRKVPFEGVIQKEDLKTRLRQALVWATMPQETLQAESRALGVPTKVGQWKMSKEERVEQLIQFMYGPRQEPPPPAEPPKAKAAAKQPVPLQGKGGGGAKATSGSRSAASQPPQRRQSSPPRSTPQQPRPKSPPAVAKFGRASTGGYFGGPQGAGAFGAPQAVPKREAFPGRQQQPPPPQQQAFKSAAAAKPKSRPKSVRPKAKPREPEPSASDEERYFGMPDVAKYGPRVKRALKKFPSYTGDLPPDPQEAEELWTDQDLHNFFFSSGFIRPKKKNLKPKITKAMINEYYRILGLKPGEKLAVVKRTYRELALRYHPDKNADSRNATEKMQGISEAYKVICKFLEEGGEANPT